MTAYIKYCGGCNETYSRSAVAKRIKDSLAGMVDFLVHDASAVYDIGVLIEGCGACCVLRNELAKCGRLFEICDAKDADAVIKSIRTYADNNG